MPLPPAPERERIVAEVAREEDALDNDIELDEKFLRAYRLTHDYGFTRFADPDYGEWFATLDRRGNRIGEAKGTARKSPFHIARNFYLCHKLLRDVTGNG